jgi:hypothetical protein
MRLRQDRGNQNTIGSNETAEISQFLLQARFWFQPDVMLSNQILNLGLIHDMSLLISRPVEEQVFDCWMGTPHQHPRVPKSIVTLRNAN